MSNESSDSSRPVSQAASGAPAPESTTNPVRRRSLLPVLQPAPAFGATSLAAGPTPIPGRSIPAVVAPKRTNISAACDTCRKKKSRCDGLRPVCGACSKRGIACEYRTVDTAETPHQALKRKHEALEHESNAYEELFRLIRSKPEADVVDIVSRIRAGGEVPDVLRHIQDGDLLLQLSLVPENRRQYEFPFAKEMPSFTLVPDNPYLQSLVYLSSSFARASSSPSGSSSHDSSSNSRRTSSSSLAMRFSDEYTQPYHAAEIVEPLLPDAKVSAWTSVISDDQLLTRLLGSYFLHQHSWTGAFHKDSFLADLANRRTRFCSSLLVNAVLATACHVHHELPNRAQFWVPQNLGYRFHAEAKRLWERESFAAPHKLTTVQAAIVLSAVSIINGMDKIGTLYLKQAIDMASELKLFQEPEAGAAMNEKMRNSRAITAWALFCWQAWSRYICYRPPLIEEPPECVLPDPAQNPDWYGETMVRYPLSKRPTPTQLALVLKANFDLRRLMAEMAYRSFDGSELLCSVEDVLEFKTKLQAWLASLPPALSPTAIALPDQFKLHMEYYGCRIALLQREVFLRAKRPDLPTPDYDLPRLISQAEIHLETLLRLYYLRHSYEAYDPILTHWLAYIGNKTIERLKQHEEGELSSDPGIRHMVVAAQDVKPIRATLLLCAKGTHSQGRSCHVAALFHHVMRQVMNADDLALLSTHIAVGGVGDEQLRIMPEYVLAEYPVPIARVGEDPRSKKIEDMLRMYGELSVEEAELADSEGSLGS